MPYWWGKLFDSATEGFLRESLRPGDTFIDVGSNVGHLMMLAADLVGPEGRVLGFEPNTFLAEATSKHARSQGLEQVRVYPFGLGRTEGQFALNIDPNHPGHSTLRDVSGSSSPDASFSEEVQVQVKRGDEVLHGVDLRGNVLLKIDVEGLEIEVLEGISELLSSQVDLVLVEVTPSWIGGSDGVQKLFDFLAARGFVPASYCAEGASAYTDVPSDLAEQANVLFRRSAD